MRKSRDNNGGECAFIHRLLRQITFGKAAISYRVTITGKAMMVLQSIFRDLTIKIVKEAFILLEVNKKKTLNPRDIQTSIRLNFGGELAKKAISYGLKSLDSSKDKKDALILKPSYFRSKVKQMNYNYRISKTSMVYLAGVIEYILSEILEISNKVTTSNKRNRINPRDVLQAITFDEELSLLFKDSIIPFGGYIATSMVSLNMLSSMEDISCE